MTNDAQLLHRYAEERAEGAFAELVRRHLNLVYFAALRRVGGDTHLAEDVAQGVFTALARRAASLTDHPSLEGWLYTTTRNVAVQAQRAARRRQVRELEAHAMQDIPLESHPEADWERLRPVIDEAMDELSEPDREAILLRFFAARSFAEVGEKLAISENAARMRAERALDKLRALLARRGITSTSVALGLVLSNQAGAVAPAGLAASVTGTALAGAGTAAIGSTVALKTLSFMSTAKLTLGIVGVVAVAATAIAIRQYQTTAQLRTEVAALREQTSALAASRAETRRITEEMTGEHAELVRLRAEKEAFIKAAAAKKASTVRASSETTPVRAAGAGGALAPGMISVDLMANAGRATPAAAAQTMVWAMQRGDTKTVASVIDFEPPERAKLEAFIATLPEKVRTDYGTPEELIAMVMSGSPRPIVGVQLLSQTQPDADTEIHSVQLQYQSGEVRQDEIKFRRDADGWKQVVSPALVDRVIGYLSAKR
ncbi:MAG TPA: sigma-70 family RNA polymerase sigma factor [Opitutaceae bacterium]|nr:sigma-70 family RNA polymerase sigma factor [Opitutaceae bacterium]